MPRGPKGEYRPTDPVQSAMLIMRIATGEITEEEAARLAPERKKSISKKPKSKPR
jgi:hypothetical protein